MKRKYFLIIASLLISLFIYLFYRTDRTVVNQMVIHLISFENYARLKASVVNALPLNDIIVYSLPEGLWIFCITLTSKSYFIRLNKWRIYLVFIPLIFCVGLEILQLLHITNGRFDWMDIGVSLIFWLTGAYVFDARPQKHDVFSTSNSKIIVCLASYCIVYLAHVFK